MADFITAFCKVCIKKTTHIISADGKTATCRSCGHSFPYSKS